MNLEKIIGNPSVAIPDELLPVIRDLAAGELKSLVLIGETQSGGVRTGIHLNLNDGDTNLATMVGGLEIAKQHLLDIVLAPEDHDDDE